MASYAYYLFFIIPYMMATLLALIVFGILWKGTKRRLLFFFVALLSLNGLETVVLHVLFWLYPCFKFLHRWFSDDYDHIIYTIARIALDIALGLPFILSMHKAYFRVSAPAPSNRSPKQEVQ